MNSMDMLTDPLIQQAIKDYEEAKKRMDARAAEYERRTGKPFIEHSKNPGLTPREPRKKQITRK